MLSFRLTKQTICIFFYLLNSNCFKQLHNLKFYLSSKQWLFTITPIYNVDIMRYLKKHTNLQLYRTYSVIWKNWQCATNISTYECLTAFYTSSDEPGVSSEKTFREEKILRRYDKVENHTSASAYGIAV